MSERVVRAAFDCAAGAHGLDYRFGARLADIPVFVHHERLVVYRLLGITDIANGAYVQPRLGQQLVVVPTDMDAALRVRRSIIASCGDAVWRAVMAASASNNPETGTIVYRFVRYCLANGASSTCRGCASKAHCTRPCTNPRANGVLAELANPQVAALTALQRQVGNEIERMRQFVRFQHVEGDLWFAVCNPSCNVVPFIMGWFCKRFNTQRFAIYDEVHHIAGISEGGKWQLVATDSIEPPPASNDEAAYAQAWKRFYRALSLDERYNPELRRSFMPKRLWHNITELQPW